MTKKLRKKPNILLTSDRPHTVYGDPESWRCTADAIIYTRRILRWSKRPLTDADRRENVERRFRVDPFDNGTLRYGMLLRHPRLLSGLPFADSLSSG